jgi:TrpR family trp operon transcriptional repressor
MVEKTYFEHAIKELSVSLAATDNPDLIEDFLKSILTPNELKEVSSRWELVKQIDDGTSQRKIADNLGLSLCKITRGSKELKKEESSFKIMIDKWRSISSGN